MQKICLQGPPGTGKTSTIVGLVSAFLGSAAPAAQPRQPRPAAQQQEPVLAAAGALRVLVCAQSNAAVDELALRLSTGILDSDSGKSRFLPGLPFVFT